MSENVLTRYVDRCTGCGQIWDYIMEGKAPHTGEEKAEELRRGENFNVSDDGTILTCWKCP
jgi:hypothetical protein